MTFNYILINVASIVPKADNRTWWEKFKDWLRGYTPPQLFFYTLKIRDVGTSVTVLLGDMVMLEPEERFLVTSRGLLMNELYVKSMYAYPFSTIFQSKGVGIVLGRTFHEGFEDKKYD